MRYDDPDTSRWTQRDPIDDPLALSGWNRYIYAGADPVNNTDADGMWYCPRWDYVCRAAHSAKKSLFHHTESAAYFPYWAECTVSHQSFGALLAIDEWWDRQAGTSSCDEGRRGHVIPHVPGVGYIGPKMYLPGRHANGTRSTCW
jgi:hypothetical protein